MLMSSNGQGNCKDGTGLYQKRKYGKNIRVAAIKARIPFSYWNSVCFPCNYESTNIEKN